MSLNVERIPVLYKVKQRWPGLLYYYDYMSVVKGIEFWFCVHLTHEVP